MAHPVIVVGTYDNRHRAELDYEHIAKNREELWSERIYALALVERTSTGKAKVVNHLEPDADKGGIAGTVVGGLLGLLYPPSSSSRPRPVVAPPARPRTCGTASRARTSPSSVPPSTPEKVRSW